MSCCITLAGVPDWYDWEGAQPAPITDLVAYAAFGGGMNPIFPGTRVRTTDFANQAWGATTLSVSGQPVCIPNGGDKAKNTADAQQWMFDHKTWNDDPTLPESLKKVMFMRAGTKWRMLLDVLVTGPVALDLVQLAFRDNGGTRGDQSGTYPVIQFTPNASGYSGGLTLMVDLKRTGRYNVVLWTKSKPTGTPAVPVYSMMEMEWIVVP